MFFRSWLRVASFGYGEYNHFGIRNFYIDCGRGIRNRIEDERRTGLDYLTEYWEKKMIIVNLDIMMARRKISLGELAEKIDITPANLSILKTGKAKAVRFSTLEAICKVLDCQPGDILEYVEGEEK